MSYFLLDESSVPSLRASKTVQIFITHSEPYGIDFVLRNMVLLLLRSVICRYFERGGQSQDSQVQCRFLIGSFQYHLKMCKRVEGTSLIPHGVAELSAGSYWFLGYIQPVIRLPCVPNCTCVCTAQRIDSSRIAPPFVSAPLFP